MKLRFSLVIAPGLLVSGLALAQTTITWIADPKIGCRTQDPRPLPHESIRWDGGCRDGLAEGRGVLQWFLDGKPTERTEGEWRAGTA